MPLRSGRWRALCFAAAALPMVAGCATHRASLASKFVTPGTPSVSFDDPSNPPPKPDVQEYARKLRAAQSKAVTKSSMLPSIETQNAALQKALLLLAIHETAAEHRAVAYAYKNAGVTDYALRHFERAIALEPCDAAAYDGMARVWRDSGFPGLALGDAYRAAHCAPGSAEIYNTLGTIFGALQQEGNARQAFQHALALNPRASFALNNMCYMELAAGHGAEAERLCRAAIAEAPGLEAARNNLALVYVLRGDVASAESALVAAGAKPNAQYNLGVLRLATGAFAEAAEAFDAAAAHPGMTLARRRAAQARGAASAMEQLHDHAEHDQR